MSNPNSQRSRAAHQLAGKIRMPSTGTPLKGKGTSILSIASFAWNTNVLPEYRHYDQDSVSVFKGKFSTYAEKVNATTGNKTKYEVAKVCNPVLFQAEFSPLMKRRKGNEPDIVKDIPMIGYKQIDHSLDMDPQHEEYYRKWIEKFTEWWIKMKQEEEGKNPPGSEVMVKLGYLRRVATLPHSVMSAVRSRVEAAKKKTGAGRDAAIREVKQFASWAKSIGVYNGPPTSKDLMIRNIISENIKKGEKTIVFSFYRQNSKNGDAWLRRQGINSMIVDGSTSNALKKSTGKSKRHEMVEQFRKDPSYPVLWAGIRALSVGMNIPEANHGIICDFDWRPDIIDQAIARMIRRFTQERVVHDYRMMHAGTIEEFMCALCYLKSRSAGEAVDYMSFDDFSAEMIPDASQYAACLVDGSEEAEALKSKMFTAVDYLRKGDTI